MITFDANVHFYALDWSDPAKQVAADRVLREAEAAKSGFVLLQALGEFAFASVRKGLFARDEAASLVMGWSSLFPVAAPHPSSLAAAIDWWVAERFSYWDALLLATAADAGATAIASEDLQDGAVVAGVEIINPFAPGARQRLALHGLAP